MTSFSRYRLRLHSNCHSSTKTIQFWQQWTRLSTRLLTSRNLSKWTRTSTLPLNTLMSPPRMNTQWDPPSGALLAQLLKPSNFSTAVFKSHPTRILGPLEGTANNPMIRTKSWTLARQIRLLVINSSAWNNQVMETRIFTNKIPISWEDVARCMTVAAKCTGTYIQCTERPV